MPYLSVVINCDSRPERNNENGLSKGVVDRELLTDNILNKVLFFKDFPDKEIIVFLDKHEDLPESTITYIQSICDCLVIRKHTSEHSFNDWNYIKALQLASGDYVCHMDMDVSAFVIGKEPIQEMIDLLETYSYVSYPSHWTPDATHDENYNYKWCSTRFFMCKRKTLNFPEIIKCLIDYEYFIEKYKPSRVNPWTEHYLGLISNSSVIYPPVDYNRMLIFTWGRYEKYTLQRLNYQTYDEVKNWVLSKGGIQYPCDVFC